MQQTNEDIRACIEIFNWWMGTDNDHFTEPFYDLFDGAGLCGGRRHEQKN
ncbi:hypothetical protein [Desulfobacter hydrogenophilus]|nr:hypothetical protein [Desulfobacter hydrogenophilus]NDY74214.1 hypothetical protein [Desulfobacter hydrogenophilus]